ncbi:hypothetical protein RJ639_040086 [Escallonia herrerae]|uniref:F-box domain-containing protein n=1 Tax=Escallonia herrerae TaxID=1293975 RepID=A0AA88WLJ0_9ASTE|nr:hypothetical protein RJ639_040086 [Escallonia herrerae]
MLHYQRRRNLRLQNLPSCILLDILIRLPIKTISQCRYVCKTLHAIVSDPYFSKIFFSRPTILIKVNSYNLDRPDSLYFLELGDNGIVLTEPKTINTNFDPKIRQLILVGSCNGLVCFCSTNSPEILYITNPLLGREYAAVEVPNFDDCLNFFRPYGFGFSPATGHYKVIKITRPGHIMTKTELHVCTLGTNEWRNLGEAPPPRFSVKFHIDVNSNTGALHWIYRNGSSNALNAFELAEERNRQIPLPPCLARSTAHIELGVLGNCLCIYDNRTYDCYVDVWTMKNYGVAESWSKDHILTGNVSAGLGHPVTLEGDGGILFLSVESTYSHRYPPAIISVFYDPERRNFYREPQRDAFESPGKETRPRNAARVARANQRIVTMQLRISELSIHIYFFYKEKEPASGLKKLIHIEPAMGIRLPWVFIHAKQIFKVQNLLTRDRLDVPKGHLAVYVGEFQKKRFVVPISYLNHPSFQDLLCRAEEEFGFDHPMGGLTIPCREDTFIDLTSLLNITGPQGLVNGPEKVDAADHRQTTQAYGFLFSEAEVVTET